MKKSILLIAITISSLNMMAQTNNIEVINALYDGFAKGDIPTVLGLMDKDIVWNEAESNSLAAGNPYIGPDAVLNGVFVQLGQMYQSFSLKDVKLYEMSNDQVLATMYYAITSKKGRKYEVQAGHHWTLENGKIVQFQQYVDTKKLAETEAQ
jgi:ketosteroid isomerase-like protein